MQEIGGVGGCDRVDERHPCRTRQWLPSTHGWRVGPVSRALPVARSKCEPLAPPEGCPQQGPKVSRVAVCGFSPPQSPGVLPSRPPLMVFPGFRGVA